MDGPVQWMSVSDYSVLNGTSPDGVLRPGRTDCSRVSSGLALVHLPVTMSLVTTGCEASEWPKKTLRQLTERLTGNTVAGGAAGS